MLVDVRCPLQKYVKKYRSYKNCNRLCIRVNPGSSGEAFCPQCHQTFLFEVSSDYVPPERELVSLTNDKVVLPKPAPVTPQSVPEPEPSVDDGDTGTDEPFVPAPSS